jgi:glycosyltransferase involved in cell wall biosynthesis
VIRRYDRAIDYWVSEPDGGISEAFNKGLRVATGEWVNFMNAGDVLASPDVLSRIAACADRNADVIYGRARMVDRHGRAMCTKGAAFDPARFRRTMTFRHQAVFHNVEYFRRYGSFDIGVTVAMDYELLRRKPDLFARFCDCTVTQEMAAGLSERRGFLRCRECRDIGLKDASGLRILRVHLDCLYAMFRCCVKRALQKLGLRCCVDWYRARSCRSL